LKVIPQAAIEKLAAVQNQNSSPGTGDSPYLNARKRSSVELDPKGQHQSYIQKPLKVTKKIKKGKK
jgi:hypothetical protein